MSFLPLTVIIKTTEIITDVYETVWREVFHFIDEEEGDLHPTCHWTKIMDLTPLQYYTLKVQTQYFSYV